jgi:hypothetical protein
MTRAADNLAAIAATLEAMRAIDRHGGATILNRAFTGFTALPPPADCWKELGVNRGERRSRRSTRRGNIRFANAGAPIPHGDHPSEGAINAARDEALRRVRP